MNFRAVRLLGNFKQHSAERFDCTYVAPAGCWSRNVSFEPSDNSDDGGASAILHKGQGRRAERSSGVSTADLRRWARRRRRYSTEPDQNSGEKSKTKPLCQLSVRPNPLFMSSGPGKWGRIWECWQACGLWVHESYSMNLLERRIMAPRQAASRPRPACFCWTELPVAGAPSSRDRNGPAPGLLLARPRDR